MNQEIALFVNRRVSSDPRALQKLPRLLRRPRQTNRIVNLAFTPIQFGLRNLPLAALDNGEVGNPGWVSARAHVGHTLFTPVTIHFGGANQFAMGLALMIDCAEANYETTGTAEARPAGSGCTSGWSV